MAKINLTTGRIASFTCDTATQAFLWDSTVPGLAVRATAGGKKAFILESRLAGKTIRLTLGDVGGINLDVARTKARKLLNQIKEGIDPREEKRQAIAAQEAAKVERERQEAADQVKSLLLKDAWNEYLEARKPKWSERHLKDHVALSQEPGRPLKRGTGSLQAGPLSSLLDMRFSELTAPVVESWLARQASERPAMAALSFRLLRAFLNWCGEHETYKAAVADGLITRRVKEILPGKKAKTDCLQKEQLAGWFAAVRQINNPVIAAYLQTLLLTGARREELAGLRWDDIDFRWKSMTIRDKVEGMRIIPLTPFVEQLLRFLPRRSEWVFSSPTAASGRIQEPRIAHTKALTVAGIDHLTLHGLRRSFGSLAEWVELPAGVVAQIMGHKPSATAERHYRVRPLDLLRKWHTTLEAWMLEQAGIAAPVERAAQPLKLAAAGGGKK